MPLGSVLGSMATLVVGAVVGPLLSVSPAAAQAGSATAAGPGSGYWEVAADGGIFTYGDAQFHGSMGGKPLNEPIVGMAATPGGGGYWEVASDGGIFAFGPGATFHGSMGGHPLAQPIVSIAATSSGGDYEVASDGGLFAYTTPFLGSMGGKHLNRPVGAMSVDPDGSGYLGVARDGGGFTFGHSPTPRG